MMNVKKLPLFLLGSVMLSALMPVQAQRLRAKVLLNSQDVLDVVLIAPRKAGTTNIRYELVDKEGVLTLSLNDVEEIRFDLKEFKPDVVSQLYYMGKYEDVIKSLARRVNPYLGFVDKKSNSNELIQLFVRSLYKSEKYEPMTLFANEIEKYAATGEMREFADIYRGLAYLKLGDLEGFKPYEELFKEADYKHPFAAPIWYGKARQEIVKNNWKDANTYLAKIITEFPMETDWSAEALFLSATYHHSRTNLVVANQICQEIQIVAPLTDWPEKAIELEETIRTQAEEIGITLVEFGGLREREREEGDSKIDYRERQRKLKEEEAERLRQELDNAEENPL